MAWTEQDFEREMRRIEALKLFRQARFERQRQNPLLVQYDLQQRLTGKPGLWPDRGAANSAQPMPTDRRADASSQASSAETE